MMVLQYGNESYQVRLLQYGLKRAGMDPGNIDGIFGRRTLRAVQQFQRAMGLAADGIAGKLTWGALYPYIVGYTLHRIAAGDTFYALAQRFGTSIEAIRIANPTLTAEALPIGAVVTVPLDLPVVTGELPASSLLVGMQVKGLAMRYPFLQSYEIGRSGMGRRIQAVSLGNGEKQIGYNASHHANEWITTLVLLRFLEEYASAAARGGTVWGVSAKELFSGTTLHMVPLVNPDGVDLVTGALDPDDSYYAQAKALSGFYPEIPFPEGWKSNIAGVDLNLQYPAEWQTARGIKFSQGFTRPGPRDYVGNAPLIAPESRAMAKWTRERDFSLTISYHTQGKIIYWQYGNIVVPGAQQIATAFSKSSGYLMEDVPYASSFAGYKDWFIQTWRRPGFTIEAGIGKNPLPLSQFDEIYRHNLPILVQGLTLSP
ncbi:MAG: peptidoglycan-binding protein [Clostridia bacterium]|nr:peptidoglycan-binding protein [Clostridia bacterium]